MPENFGNSSPFPLPSAGPTPVARNAAFAATLTALLAMALLSYLLAILGALLVGDEIARRGLDSAGEAGLRAVQMEEAGGLIRSVIQGLYLLKAVAVFQALTLAFVVFPQADRPLAVALFGGAYLVLVVWLGIALEPAPGLGSAGGAVACLALYAWCDLRAGVQK